MGRRCETTREITEYTPERSFTTKSTSGPISYLLSYTLEAVDRGTHLSLHFQGDPKGLFKVAEPLLASTVKKEFGEDHARLKGLLESQASGSIAAFDEEHRTPGGHGKGIHPCPRPSSSPLPCT